jgi:hypothetical protein
MLTCILKAARYSFLNKVQLSLGLSMTFKQHVTITSVLAIILTVLWRNYFGSLLFWLGGIFIDLDHYLDYIKETGSTRVSFKKMEDMFLNIKEKKFYGVLHSYEVLVILFFVNFFYFEKGYLYGLLGGLSLHILLDVIFNPVKIKGYLFLYRWKHSFEVDRIFEVKR